MSNRASHFPVVVSESSQLLLGIVDDVDSSGWKSFAEHWSDLRPGNFCIVRTKGCYQCTERGNFDGVEFVTSLAMRGTEKTPFSPLALQLAGYSCDFSQGRGGDPPAFSPYCVRISRQIFAHNIDNSD
jgi:hypothetical protein